MARAEATVNIEVKGALQGAAEVKALDKAVTGLERRMSGLSSGAKTAAQTMTTVTSVATKTRKVFDSFDKGIAMMGKALSSTLGLALKGTILQMGLLSAALVGVHALFVAGKWLHKAYSAGMQMIAGAAAGAAVALGTAAAAIREQQAAMYAYKGKGMDAFGKGLNQTRVAMRSLHRDANLAGLGVEALNKAYASMSKSMNASQIAKSTGLMKNLMDFGSAGQDPAAAAEKVGAVIAALNDSKKTMADVKTAAKELGPEMEQALKKAKITSKKQLREMIMSGELAKIGGVAGQFEAVNETLMGKMKRFFNMLKADFGDFGQEFLGPAKKAIEEIYRIIRRDLVRVSGDVASFGRGPFMETLVNAIDKTSNFFVKLMREWLPKTAGFFDKIGNWWDKVSRWFKLTKENLRPYIDGAKAIEGMFKNIWVELKAGIKESMQSFNQQVQLHSGDIEEFGTRIGKLINAVMDVMRTFRKQFFDALPFINDVVKGITDVVQMLNGVFSKFTSMFGGQGGAGLMAMAIIFRQMKNFKGGFLGKDNAMPNSVNIQTPVVNINGPGGPKTPGGPQGPGPKALPPGPVYPGIGPGRPPLAIGPGPKAIGPGGGGSGGALVPYTQGPVMYDNQGRPLTGGRRHIFDWRRRPSDYPNPDAKLVRRGNSYIDPRSGKRVYNSGSFRALIPGQGLAGTTGRVYEQVPTAAQMAGINRPPLAGTAGQQLALPAGPPIAAAAQPRITGSLSPSMVKKLQDRVAYGGQGADLAAAKLAQHGHPITPGAGPSSGFSSGAAPGPGGGGGSPGGGVGGPGNAPPGANGPGTTGATTRPGMYGRAKNWWQSQYNPAFGQTGQGQDLFRTPLTGNQWATATDELDANGNKIIRSMRGGQMGEQIGTINDAGQVRTMKGAKMGLSRRMRMTGMANRSRRESALGSKILGNEAKGIKGINNSMGAKMAVGMGMSLASQFMPQEAQGAMALGGMVGQFNPLAGLAVGFGGAALKARTAKGGALTGAAAGAAIGTMIAPGLGTAIGAALGGITGAVMGWRNGMKQRAKEAKEAVNSFLNNIQLSSLTKAGERLAKIEAKVAAGGDISRDEGALQGVASEMAAKYRDVGSRFAGIDLNLQKRNDQKALNFSTSNMGGWNKGWKGLLTGQSKWGRRLNPIGWAQTGLGLITRGGSQLLGGLGRIPGLSAVSKIPGMGWLTGNNNINDDQKKALKIIDDIRKDPMYKGMISDEEYKKIKKSPVAGLTELGKQLPDRIDAATTIGTQTEVRMKRLQEMSGKSGAELEQLAKKLGVDLYDPMVDFTELVTKLGFATRKSVEELKHLNIDTFVKGVTSAFDAEIKKLKDPFIYDEAAVAVRGAVEGGGGNVAILEALKSFQESSLGMYDSPIEALYGQAAQLGTKEKPGTLFQPGGAFYGMDPNAFFTEPVQNALRTQFKQTETGFMGTAATDISAQFANAGFISNEKQINSIMAGMTEENRKKFLLDYQQGAINFTNPLTNMTDDEKKKALGGKTEAQYMQERAASVLSRYGSTATVSLSKMDEGANLVADKMDTASKTFETAVNDFSASMSQYFSSSSKPEWMTKKFIDLVAKQQDTSTPRGGVVGDTTTSRIERTMARHASINNGIPGRRTITSGYRTYGLGSLNSDHITGRAIDIVGQNLGSYAVATRNAGGFAEFHGSGDNRHLHAVPGPGAIGDSMTPSVNNSRPLVMQGGGSSGGNNYTFHINGANYSPEEIANVVMAKIKQTESVARERT